MPVPTLAVWKFASCDGCQLTLLDCEDELLAIADRVNIAHFTEASSETRPGPYDVSLVEGSITTAADAERIRQVREMSRTLVTIGACATAGGVQALRNFADVREFTSVVYARPDYISALGTSTPIAAHVDVDFELHGCPIDRRQLLEVITALLAGRKPNIPAACCSTGTPSTPKASLPPPGSCRPPRRIRPASKTTCAGSSPTGWISMTSS
jgi:sulfhydrogenase subunit delta